LRTHNTALEAGVLEIACHGDEWRAGITADYKIAENLATKQSVQCDDPDNADDYVEGFLRFQRNF
jgi:hypothetical protein